MQKLKTNEIDLKNANQVEPREQKIPNEIKSEKEKENSTTDPLTRQFQEVIGDLNVLATDSPL